MLWILGLRIHVLVICHGLERIVLSLLLFALPNIFLLIYKHFCTTHAAQALLTVVLGVILREYAQYGAFGSSNWVFVYDLGTFLAIHG